MRRTRMLRRLALLQSAVAAGLAYRYYVLPRIRTWAATPEEAVRPMAGDELVATPSFSGTHAVTIAATPEDVWPWLLQIGAGRAGFYSYTWIERAMGLTVENANRILPQYQGLTLGDRIPFGPGAELPIVAIDRFKHLCLGGPVGIGAVTWCFAIYPQGPNACRLVSRNRASAPDWTIRSILSRPSAWRTELPMKLFIDLGGLVMVARMLDGIKRRAERLAMERAAEREVLVLSSGCE